MSTRTRRGYIHRVFEGQCEIALANLASVHSRIGDSVDCMYVCGTDFGTQTSAFCSVATFRELWFPYYQRVNHWVHANTNWKCFKHSCGSVERFLESFIEAGFDIVNPVQCSAAGMDPAELKRKYGSRLVFWGGGVDTQKTLPFGSPREVREEVLRRCEIFAPGGGFVFSAIHNLQAGTPVENLSLIHISHNWASAECVLYLRHMLALEDGRSLRLLAGIGKPELAAGEPFAIAGSPTRFGRISLQLEPLGRERGWRLHFEREAGPEPASVILPPGFTPVDPAARKWSATWTF